MLSPKIILGIDYGTRQIGIAIADSLTRQAKPEKILRANNLTKQLASLLPLIESWQPNTLIIGFPVSDDPKGQWFRDKINEFITALQAQFTGEIIVIDECYSSKFAREHLRTNAIPCPKDKIDDWAAVMILQRWLDQHHNT